MVKSPINRARDARMPPEPRPAPHGRLCTTLVMRRAPRVGPAGPVLGHLRIGAITLPCALGAAGVTQRKREGDKATPAGPMRILYGFYRPDRMARPLCDIPLRPLPRRLLWCDEPGTALYNRPSVAPLREGHEILWRDDGLYDLMFVLDYNLAPRRNGRGSAIFFHCARSDLTPTLGCVALRRADMRRLLSRLSRRATIEMIA